MSAFEEAQGIGDPGIAPVGDVVAFNLNFEIVGQRFEAGADASRARRRPVDARRRGPADRRRLERPERLQPERGHRGAAPRCRGGPDTKATS
jgi:hypothetical protein